MKKVFAETKSRKRAQEQCPWAEKIVKVDGGYLCFESASDYGFNPRPP